MIGIVTTVLLQFKDKVIFAVSPKVNGFHEPDT